MTISAVAGTSTRPGTQKVRGGAQGCGGSNYIGHIQLLADRASFLLSSPGGISRPELFRRFTRV